MQRFSMGPKIGQTGRELCWCGLAATCSKCGWLRGYNPETPSYHFPSEEVSEIIRAEFEGHECAQFASQRDDGQP